MPRRHRILVEGALYHVYNRASHGEAVFGEGALGQRFAELLAQELGGDGHQVYAWVVMANHYHVVLRSSAVSLARSFGKIQSSFGRERNRIIGSAGPTWQGRYRAKMVEDEGYLMQLIAYVHLNPVQAGIVGNPVEHELSGHREIVGLADFGLVARDQVLTLYGDTEAQASHHYESALASALGGDTNWLDSTPGHLPWWKRQVDRPLKPPPLSAWVDSDGRPHREARPRLSALAFTEAACIQLGTSLDHVTETSRRRELTELRFLVIGLGIERWSQRAGELAEVFGRRSDYVSWWAKRARELRLSDPAWAEKYETLDEGMRRDLKEGESTP